MTAAFRVLPVIAAAAMLSVSDAQSQPTFDCAKAEHEAETAICKSPALAELDVELARLYGLAVASPDLSEEARDTLKATQRGWIKGRDDCWKSDVGLDRCIADSYALRIDEIRTGYAAAREGDGASLGPFAFDCAGLGAGLSVVYVTTSDQMAVLRWLDNSIVLPIARSGSGSRYASDETLGGPSELWLHQGTARFTPPGGETYECKEDDIG